MTSNNWQSATVHANGLNIHYNRTGDGSQPPLVMAHGFSDTGLCWTPLAEAFSADYDVIMPDARHHGSSDSPDQPFSILDLADDLAGVITALDLQRPILLGHSLGAITTLLLAGRYPQLPRAILLEDPPPWWASYSEPPFEPKWAVPARQGLILQQAESREAIIAKKHAESPTWAEAELGPWADAKLSVKLRALDRVVVPTINWPGLLQQVVCPVLLITADPDLKSAVTAKQANELRDLLPQTHIAHIGGAGHNIRREQFDAYLEVLRAFLSEAAPQP
jgi:N-formylmaleamate deformylase